MIDTFPPLSSCFVIQSLLSAMAASKMNVLHWHVTDDQSFPFQVSERPLLSGKGAFTQKHTYSPTDVGTIVSSARDLGIRVIPEFDTPGHSLSWGQGYPNLLTPCPDDNGNPISILNVASNNTFDAVRSVLRAASPLSDQTLHLGGDEIVTGCWAGNNDVKMLMRRLGVTTIREVLLYWFRVVQDIGKSLGTTAFIVWQDVF
eukprot:jgi/Botrbrau1/6738/Bobra.0324s0024.1